MASTSKITEDQQKEYKIEISDNLETTMRKEFCIYRVPRTLHQINPPAYSPHVISIGPIHHGKSELQEIEIQKLRYFKEFCKRKRQSSTDDDFGRTLFNQIDEQEIRHCYAYDCSISSSDFVNMILLDSVFILELFLTNNDNVTNYENDYIMGNPLLRTDVQRDLILLENQLPFSILEKLYNFATGSFVCGVLAQPSSLATMTPESLFYPPLHQLACNYFSKLRPGEAKMPRKQEKILHFIDLVRHIWIDKHPAMKTGSIDRLFTITKLRQAGLKVRPAPDRCLMDIEFRPGSFLRRSELKLPCIYVDSTTEFVVRNMMAFEQCRYPSQPYICSYVRLLDFLIDTAEDVDLVVEKEILANRLGESGVVADLVNQLCKQIPQERSSYFVTASQLNDHYGSAYNRAMATLRSVYCGDPWRATGTIAAVVLLVLTLMQTVFSFFAL